jgi:uncharacterized membrane protein
MSSSGYIFIEVIQSIKQYVKEFYEFFKVYFEMLKHQKHTNDFFKTRPHYVAQKQTTTNLMHQPSVVSFLLSCHHSKLFFVQNSVHKEQNVVNNIYICC